VAFRDTVVLIITVGSFPEASIQSDHSSGLIPMVVLKVSLVSPVAPIDMVPD